MITVIVILHIFYLFFLVPYREKYDVVQGHRRILDDILETDPFLRSERIRSGKQAHN